MSPLRAAAIAPCAILAGVAWTDQVRADCMNSKATDACVVGTWKQTGGGAAEWMRQNLKMAQVSVSASNATLTFNSDGTFSTSAVDASAQVVAKEGAPMQATGHMTAQGKGQWSAADGKLNLCMTAVNSSGSVEMQGDHGMAAKVPMPQMQPAPLSMTYTCNGDTLSTVQPMPKNTTMATTYTKVH